MKARYRHQDLLTTLANMLAAAEQDALLHPYPFVVERATEALPVLREALQTLSHKEVTKNEALNIIARIPATTKGAQAAIPIMRTPITSGNLDRVSAIRSFDTARELCAIGRDTAKMTSASAQELDRWRWTAEALVLMERCGLKAVNFSALVELSRTAVSYPMPGGTVS